MNSSGVEIEFLGTGTSTGVPVIRCQCEVCRSTDVRDKRFRSSVIVRTQGVNLLVDCGPDFRSQMLAVTNPEVDALLVTHIHYDHVGGLDDLRVFCGGGEHDMPVYARADVFEELKRHMDYCFVEHPYPGVPSFETHVIDDKAFSVFGVEVTPIPVMHGKLPIVGYRIGDVAYVTDAKTIPQESINKLRGVKLLVINALRHTQHHSHMTLEESLSVIKGINPQQAYLTHVCHEIGVHAQVEKQLPAGVKLAYDGLVVRI
ncbi:MBL fold metallo-hydrolase [Sodaliphilus sp.]|uniref:MBL fold metallo-hydrolase n=1 Tax=Sodaliphilus sp. TaxID=2815818 RepID=UPI00388D025D